MAFQPLVFTDLDGTLLDHFSYDYQPALPALRSLQEDAIPVIPNTSKTTEEIAPLLEELGCEVPFIAENGAAIYLPHHQFGAASGVTCQWQHYRVIENSPARSHWLRLLEALKPEYGDQFVSFEQAGAKGIAEMTGLSLEQAKLANSRCYSEPVAWRGSEQGKQAFIAAIAARGGHVLQGGRFLTLAGDCDKGRAMQQLAALYCDQNSAKTITLALGDSPNDSAMLEAADFAALIRSPKHPFPVLSRSANLYHSTKDGPHGWAEAIAWWRGQLNL